MYILRVFRIEILRQAIVYFMVSSGMSSTFAYLVLELL